MVCWNRKSFNDRKKKTHCKLGGRKNGRMKKQNENLCYTLWLLDLPAYTTLSLRRPTIQLLRPLFTSFLKIFFEFFRCKTWVDWEAIGFYFLEIEIESDIRCYMQLRNYQMTANDNNAFVYVCPNERIVHRSVIVFCISEATGWSSASKIKPSTHLPNLHLLLAISLTRHVCIYGALRMR